ncbi:MAG: proteasome subunit alpha [Verrucomicrobiae bacterium]|nr:proteasome subunit alpha [Verrucomicrobiae bacterium]
MGDSLPPPLAGDFFALLARHHLQNPAPDASASLPPTQIQATTVFAFHFAGGVLMAGDRRATAGHLIVTEQVDKILELDASSLLAIAGVPATAFEIARTLKTSFEYYRRSQLQSLSLPARLRALSRALRDNLPLTLQGVGVVAPLFAGLDTTSSPPRPQIYFYDPLGAQFQAAAFAASGSGAITIRSLLSFQERFGSPTPSRLPRREAVQLALRVLTVAAEFDTATGGIQPDASRFATLRILGPDGISTVDDAEQRDALG